jgi:diguanylate cyclase (GGDEF)-like protein
MHRDLLIMRRAESAAVFSRIILHNQSVRGVPRDGSGAEADIYFAEKLSQVGAYWSHTAARKAHVGNPWNCVRLVRMTDNFKNLITVHPDGLVVVDDNGRVLFANPTIQLMLAGRPAWREQLPAELLAHQENHIRFKSPDAPNAELTLEIRRIRVAWNRHAAHMLLVRDVTQLSEQRSAALRMAHQDELTGLYNRRGLEFVGAHEWARALRSGNPLTVLFGDLDNLKSINDRYGHREGDRALIETAQLLSRVFRDADVVARYGGDEFVVLFIEEHAPSTATQLLKRLEAEIARRNAATHCEWKLSISTGIARLSQQSGTHRSFDLTELIARADRDMYREKHARRKVAAAKPKGKSAESGPDREQ